MCFQYVKPVETCYTARRFLRSDLSWGLFAWSLHVLQLCVWLFCEHIDLISQSEDMDVLVNL